MRAGEIEPRIKRDEHKLTEYSARLRYEHRRRNNRRREIRAASALSRAEPAHAGEAVGYLLQLALDLEGERLEAVGGAAAPHVRARRGVIGGRRGRWPFGGGGPAN